MTRDEFRKAVFERDNHECVICREPAQDAHHILERRLFPDGGYELDNGASLCGTHHIEAEKTTLDADRIRNRAGITRVVLPPHLYPDYEYDKWGNIINNNGSRVKGELFYDESVQKILKEGDMLNRFLPYVKYPRTFHLPFSGGRTSDDRALEDCSQFENRDVVVTLKMDGENTSGYYDGHVHARSIDSDNHPSRNWVKNFLAGRLCQLPAGWRMCGENLYAKHSIHYRGLQSYFNLFSLWDDRNNCLSWDSTVEWAGLLDIHVVPVLYRGLWNQEKIEALWRPHLLDGNEMEGYVVRLADQFNYSQFRNSVAKFVRANHVQTNQHWVRGPVVKNEMEKS